ncbi:hypothetical protein Pcinc_020920, partial [Petrolisthes cinctipes]
YVDDSDAGDGMAPPQRDRPPTASVAFRLQCLLGRATGWVRSPLLLHG